MAPRTEVTFRVEATGDCLQFQWQKDRSDLSDGGRYCDTKTDTLRIVDVKKRDKGRYRCLVRNDLGSNFFSDEVLLTVSKFIIAVGGYFCTSCIVDTKLCSSKHRL